MGTDTWNLMKELYKERFGLEKDIILDYIAINDILLQCVSGISNEKLAYSLNLELWYVQEVLNKFLGFSGWQRDLDLSPWYLFRSSHGSKLAFEKQIKDLTNLLDDDIIDLAYRICLNYQNIRSEIEDFYDRS